MVTEIDALIRQRKEYQYKFTQQSQHDPYSIELLNNIIWLSKSMNRREGCVVQKRYKKINQLQSRLCTRDPRKDIFNKFLQVTRQLDDINQQIIRNEESKKYAPHSVPARTPRSPQFPNLQTGWSYLDPSFTMIPPSVQNFTPNGLFPLMSQSQFVPQPWAPQSLYQQQPATNGFTAYGSVPLMSQSQFVPQPWAPRYQMQQPATNGLNLNQPPQSALSGQHMTSNNVPTSQP